jgi:cell fate regulator YaaT (PSP1 superfamily)
MQHLRSQDEILDAMRNISEGNLVIRLGAVTRVLTELLNRQISSSEAQVWASFIRRGYVSTNKKPVKTIDISYQQDHEDAIAYAISRLDELGDIVDGTIEDDELRSLIDDLSSGS